MAEETGEAKAAADEVHAYNRFSNSEKIEKGWSSKATSSFLTSVARTELLGLGAGDSNLSGRFEALFIAALSEGAPVV